MSRYNPKEVEPKWQSVWKKTEAFKTRDDPARPKYFVLEMFPYPSGNIHVGHVRNYSMGDVIARYKRARGYNVLHPMGWDAFGLPAENAAMQTGKHPRDWTYANIETMRGQLQTRRLCIRLGPRTRDLRPRVLPASAAVVSRLLEGGFRRAPREPCELGPGRHDRPRQRAGD